MALTDPHAVQLIDEVVQGNKRLLLGVVRPLGGTEPPEGAVMHARADELYEVGTLGTVVRMLKLGDGSVRVMVQGLERARLVEVIPAEHWLVAGYEPLPNTVLEDARTEALKRTVHAQFSRVIDIAPYLGEELRVIRQELGEEEGEDELTELAGRLEAAGLHDEAKKVVDRELKRLRQMSPQSAEYHVARTYLEVIASLPWGRTSEDRLDLKAARDILDRDHYDLKPVKERILEYLAVRTLNPAARGGILCFVGPPGVGKTSLGQSIAEALRDAQSPVDAGRGGQDGRRRARRSDGRPARGARPDAERHLRGSLPRSPVRPLGRHVHRHGQQPGAHPRPIARPDGSAHLARVHARGEARDRQALPLAAPAQRDGAADGAGQHRRRGARAAHRGIHARGRRAPARAGDPGRAPQGRPRGGGGTGGDHQDHGEEPREVRRPAQSPERGGGTGGRGRSGDRARMDARGRRHHVHRGDSDAGERADHLDRAAG